MVPWWTILRAKFRSGWYKYLPDLNFLPWSQGLYFYPVLFTLYHLLLHFTFSFYSLPFTFHPKIYIYLYIYCYITLRVPGGVQHVVWTHCWGQLLVRHMFCGRDLWCCKNFWAKINVKIGIQNPPGGLKQLFLPFSLEDEL